MLSDVSVVIPCHNEEQSVATVIRSLPQGIGQIVVVDNMSTDRTAEIARGLGADVIVEPLKGYGASIKAGFRAAHKQIIVTVDGDDQYPAYRIIELVENLEKSRVDFISACRFPLNNRASLPLIRVIGNRILTSFANILFGLRLKDSQSGMWVFRRAVLDETPLRSNGMAFSEEIKIRIALNRKFSFIEVHIPYHPRVGTSKLSPLRHGWENMRFLFSLRRELR